MWVRVTLVSMGSQFKKRKVNFLVRVSIGCDQYSWENEFFFGDLCGDTRLKSPVRLASHRVREERMTV